MVGIFSYTETIFKERLNGQRGIKMSAEVKTNISYADDTVKIVETIDNLAIS